MATPVEFDSFAADLRDAIAALVERYQQARKGTTPSGGGDLCPVIAKTEEET